MNVDSLIMSSCVPWVKVEVRTPAGSRFIIAARSRASLLLWHWKLQRRLAGRGPSTSVQGPSMRPKATHFVMRCWRLQPAGRCSYAGAHRCGQAVVTRPRARGLAPFEPLKKLVILRSTLSLNFNAQPETVSEQHV